jgi:hypothetical protein
MREQIHPVLAMSFKTTSTKHAIVILDSWGGIDQG